MATLAIVRKTRNQGWLPYPQLLDLRSRMPDFEAERVGPAWSESPKGTDTEGESALRTTSEMARTGLRVGDGHHSSSPCAGLLNLAWLAETHTVSRSAKDGRTRLCPEVLGNSKRTKADIGTTPVLQRGPLPLRRTDPKSGLLSDGSASTPFQKPQA